MKMKFINLPVDYEICAEILSKRVGLDKLDGTITFESFDGMRVWRKGNDGGIACSKKHHFARLIGLFAEHAKRGGDFDVSEAASFRTLSCMLDISFGSALTVKSFHEF